MNSNKVDRRQVFWRIKFKKVRNLTFLKNKLLGYILVSFNKFAAVAQLVEHLICNQAVGGSSPLSSSICYVYASSSLEDQRWTRLIYFDVVRLESGQIQETVNLPPMASKVQILLSPPRK